MQSGDLAAGGTRFVSDVVGRQEAEPRDRGPLSACRWAGRSGLCGQAQGPAGCKLISPATEAAKERRAIRGPSLSQEVKPPCKSESGWTTLPLLQGLGGGVSSSLLVDWPYCVLRDTAHVSFYVQHSLE